MKITAAIPVLAALAPVIHGQNVHVRTSDNLIDVGDLDLFENTWQRIYSAWGNRESVTIGPPPIGVQSGRCHFNGNPDRHVTLTVEGAWDDVGGNHHEYRDAMIEAAWEALRRISDQHAFPVWRDCCRNTIGLVCSQNACLNGSCGCGADVRCGRGVQGHRVPSVLNVSVSRNGRLTANNLRITFRSDAVEASGGCGTAGTIARGLVSFLFPNGIGEIVGTGIDLSCG